MTTEPAASPAGTPPAAAPGVAAPAQDGPPSLLRLVLLHLLPGLAAGLAAGLIGWLARPLGWPGVLPLLLAVPLTVLPIELGYLLWQGKQRSGRWTLRGAIGYEERLSWKEYAIWVPLTFFAALVLFVLLGGTDVWLFQSAFAWWPDWVNPDQLGLTVPFTPLVWWTVILLMLVANLCMPVVEELYFRGHLLSRMEHLGHWAVPLNGFLFALYHFWSPWHLISRAIGILPLGYVARRKRNAIIPAAVHVLLNTIGSLLTIASVFQT